MKIFSSLTLCLALILSHSSVAQKTYEYATTPNDPMQVRMDPSASRFIDILAKVMSLMPATRAC